MEEAFASKQIGKFQRLLTQSPDPESEDVQRMAGQYRELKREQDGQVAELMKAMRGRDAVVLEARLAQWEFESDAPVVLQARRRLEMLRQSDTAGESESGAAAALKALEEAYEQMDVATMQCLIEDWKFGDSAELNGYALKLRQLKREHDAQLNGLLSAMRGRDPVVLESKIAQWIFDPDAAVVVQARRRLNALRGSDSPDRSQPDVVSGSEEVSDAVSRLHEAIRIQDISTGGVLVQEFAHLISNPDVASAVSELRRLQSCHDSQLQNILQAMRDQDPTQLQLAVAEWSFGEVPAVSLARERLKQWKPPAEDSLVEEALEAMRSAGEDRDVPLLQRLVDEWDGHSDARFLEVAASFRQLKEEHDRQLNEMMAAMRGRDADVLEEKIYAWDFEPGAAVLVAARRRLEVLRQAALRLQMF